MMDIEQEASALGWVPKDQFKGDPEKWTDAETFVQRGKDIMPILRKNNEKLVHTVESLSGEVAQLKTTLAAAHEAMETFKQFHEETAKREYDRAVADLKVQRKQAREAGDHDLADEITDSIKDLDQKAKAPAAAPAPAPAATPAPAPAPELDPEYVAWERDNSVWLADNQKKTYAQSVAGYVKAMNPTLTGRKFLDKVTAEVEAHFGGSSNQRVEGGGTTPSRGGKSYGDLPAEAKSACDRMAAKLVGAGRAFATLEDWRKSYVKSYSWE